MLELKIEERQELVQIIGGLSTFTTGGPRGRQNLIEQAGLRRFLSGMDLTGAPRDVAGELVRKSEAYGYLRERPVYHALGALLSYVLTLGDLPSEQGSSLASLIVRYSLVLDPAYIDKLRTDYNITDSVVHTPPPSQLVPPRPLFVGSEIPTFDTTIPDKQGLERIINSEDNFLDIYLLAGAIYSAQAVCRIENRDAKAIGTGVLIGPDLLLTNEHVLKAREDLSTFVVRFDYRIDASGVAQAGRVFELQPDFHYTSNESALDYALVRLQDRPLKHIPVPDKTDDLSYLNLLLHGKHRGYLVLAERFIKGHDRVNIIQHPDGQPMKVVLTQNYVVTDMEDTRVQYVVDTMDGSSGSPVFNQNWEVVALHHSGEPYPPDSAQNVLKKAWKGRFRVNEGIPIRAILKDFRRKKLERYLPRT